jgi:hypothetical protein
MAETTLSGIALLNPEFQKYVQLRDTLISPEARKLPLARTRELIPELSALPGLAPTDYTGQLGEASQMAKLQLGLALAARGFGSMGAQPRPGEMAISTLGREMLAPLGGDAMAVAQQLYDQKLKLTAAEKAQKAALSQAALSAAQAEQAGDISFKEKLLLDLAGRTPSKFTIKSVDNVQIKRDGDQWVDSPSHSATNPTTGQTIYYGPNNEVLHFVKGPNGEEINARLFETTEGSQYETSESRAVEITQKTLDFVKSKFGVDLSKDLLGEKAFIQTYNPKGDFPDLKSFSKLQIAGHTLNLSKPMQGQTISPTELSNMSEMWVAPGAETYAGHYVVVNSKTNEPVYESGRRVDVSRGPGNELFRFNTTIQYVPGKNTKVVGADKVDAAKAAVTDAQRATDDRVGALYATMGQIQTGQEEGKFSAYNAGAALYFDPAAYLAKELPFKYVPPGTAVNDRSRDVTITNSDIQELLSNKMRFIANTVLKSDYGSVEQETKTKRMAQAVKEMLSVPPSTLFGASAIDVIGTDREGNLVGYAPDKGAFSPAVINKETAIAMETMRTDPNANASVAFSPVAIPDNEAALRKSGGRMRVATKVFPNAFSNTGGAGTELYDSQLVQRRLDIEAVLMDAPLALDASLTEHRALLQKRADAKVKERNTIQNGTDARFARDAYDLGLEFRDALLNFKNAAAESGVEGFFTGRAASILSRIGFSKWIVGDGATHWDRLSIASERFQQGISRRVGNDFGDNKISNLDAEAYQKLVPDIRSGPEYNRILVEDGLQRVNRDLTDLMAQGGRVAWTERDLERAAEAGVDFSDLNTQMNWHGYGYYGKSRYSTSRQYTPALSDAQRDDLRTTGQLKDTLYGGAYTVPLLNYSWAKHETDQLPTFSLGSEATEGAAAVAATRTQRMGPLELEFWVQDLAERTKVPPGEIMRRVVRAIHHYNIWRDTVQ